MQYKVPSPPGTPLVKNIHRTASCVTHTSILPYQLVFFTIKWDISSKKFGG